MEFLTILVIAIALAMDCFAVSMAAGTVIKDRRIFSAVVMGLFFGTFQMGMALIGWAAGGVIASMIGFIDHWIAFGIIAVIGVKMMYEGFRGEVSPERDYMNMTLLIILAIATSIDSLGVGLSLALLSTGIVFAALIIGITSFVLSFWGVVLGSRLSARFGQPIEIAGGLVLVGIGIRVLLGHLSL